MIRTMRQGCEILRYPTGTETKAQEAGGCSQVGRGGWSPGCGAEGGRSYLDQGLGSSRGSATFHSGYSERNSVYSCSFKPWGPVGSQILAASWTR